MKILDFPWSANAGTEKKVKNLKFYFLFQLVNVQFKLFIGFYQVVHCAAGMEHGGVVFFSAVHTN